MRIYELAKQLNAKSEVLVDLLLIAGFEVKSHMSRLDDGMLVEISEHFKLPPKIAAKAKEAKVSLANKEATAAKKASSKKVKIVRKADVTTVKTEEIRTDGDQTTRTVTVKTKSGKKAVVEKKVHSKPKVEPEKPEEADKAKVEAKKEEKSAAEKPEDKAAEKSKKSATLDIITSDPVLKGRPKAPGRVIVQAEPPKPEPKPEPKPKPKEAHRADAKPKEKTRGSEVKEHTKVSKPAKAPDKEKKAEHPRRPVAEKKRRPEQQLPPRKGRGGKKKDPVDVEAQERAVRESVRRTLAKIDTTRKTKRRKSKPLEDGEVAEKAVQVVEGQTVRELADLFKADANDIIMRCLDLGITATINQGLDRETIEIIADDLEMNVEFVADEIESLLKPEKDIDESRFTPRSPIVTVMGHVDHGKTSILDFIRKTRVAAGEAGGITQHIGAYEVDLPKGKITFVDTPGHEAFTAMRARGAQITDIVVLVVAADDGVMPQTREAVNHARDAEVPLVVAVNKMDLPGANPANVKTQLMEHEVVAEEFGGDVIFVEVSAKTGDGIDKLLEMILLQADLLELKADADASAFGVVVEVKKEEGRGNLCTVLVTQGTLRIGNIFVIGHHYGKVRALFDHRGKPIKEALPAMPVLVLGSNGLPEAGDKMTVVASEREARDLSLLRQQAAKDRDRRMTKKLTLEELYTQFEEGAVKELRLIIKGDTNGSIEALSDNLSLLTVEDIGVKVIHSGVGVVNESDVLLADSSDAIIIAFGVKVSPEALNAASKESIEIRAYDVIYECISEVDEALHGMLEPVMVERVLGRAEVRQIFRISRLGLIAGSFVIEGTINRNAQVRVLRDEEEIFDGKLSSLKRFQDDVRDVQKDFECGIGVAGISDLREGDIVEAYVIEEKAKVV